LRSVRDLPRPRSHSTLSDVAAEVMADAAAPPSSIHRTLRIGIVATIALVVMAGVYLWMRPPPSLRVVPAADTARVLPHATHPAGAEPASEASFGRDVAAATPAAPAAPAATPTVATPPKVTVRLIGLPSDVPVQIDGRPWDQRPLTLPRSPVARTLSIAAEGYAPKELTLTPNMDQSLRVTLHHATESTRPHATSSRAAKPKKPTASPLIGGSDL
jgi:hypothetical protein